MARVYVALAVGGWIRHELAQELIILSHDRRHQLDMSGLFVVDARPLPCARHTIINKFLKTDADWLLMYDGDVIPRGNLLDLVDLDLDIVAAACPIWRAGSTPPIVLNARPVDGSTTIPFAGDPLVEVTQASTSAILIARRVLEHPDLKNPFAFQYDGDGLLTVDDDITFFHKARAVGFRIWVSLEHLFGHMKEVDISYVHSAVREWDG